MPRCQRVAEAEDLESFGEERPLLRIERLELCEVDDRGIDLDLPEIGIQRAGERQRRGERVLEIEAAVDLLLRLLQEWIGAIEARLHVGARGGVGHELERRSAVNAFEAVEIGE